MAATFAEVNGIRIAYRVQGAGTPLVLVMDISSAAWPPVFVEALARQFTVITLDSRGTGFSDKPGSWLCDSEPSSRHPRAARRNSRFLASICWAIQWGAGAIAQEFVRQFLERVQSPMLYATMCGGTRATYAKPSVTRVMREIDGLSPEQIARRIWQVTYAPAYLERHEALPKIKLEAKSHSRRL